MNWPSQRKLVSVLAWTLMPNHFHILLKIEDEGGLAKFMQKLGNSMSSHFNKKYQERGSIFQGAYHSKTVGSDTYLRWLTSYILVKNVFELYPGGLEEASVHFDSAWEWAIQYPFSSLRDFVDPGTARPFMERDILGDLFPAAEILKKASRDMVMSRTWERNKELQEIMLD